MLKLHRDFIATLKKLETTMKGVQDKETADSAASQSAELCTHLLDLINTGRSYGRPDAATAKLLKEDAAQSGAALETTAGKALTAMLTVYFQNCYGSDTLREAIQPFMNEMLCGEDELESTDQTVPDVPDVAQPSLSK